jgi:hypothetical protein
MLCFLLLSPGVSPASPADAGLADLRSYLVQMHVHGHSNHNGNDLPASMESHCSEAARTGFDVIWWTDHERLFESFSEAIVVDFDDALFDADSTVLVFDRKTARSLTRFAIDRPREGARLELKNETLTMEVESRPGSSMPNRLSLSLASERDRVRLVDFCRPVTSGLEFMAWGWIRGLGEDASVRVYFDFSWHPAGQHHAVFDLVRAGGGRRILGDTTVVQEIEIAGEGLNLVIDLGAALALLPNGDDNTLSSCRIEIAARRGESISVAIDSLKFVSTRPDGENQYRNVEKLVRRYQEAYGVTQYVGVEVGLMHRPTRPHMNAYLPVNKTTFENTRVGADLGRNDWIRKIKELGGIVCVDHPFGAALRRQYMEGYDPALGVSLRQMSQKQGVVDESYFQQVAEGILETDAWGADMLEVGYLFRGAGSLEDHLRLWDVVLANGIRLIGFGSSDSHGGRWEPNMEPNPFASWIWSQSDGADDLLEAMRLGRVVFGDPFLWKSNLAFGVEGALMGDTLFVGKHEEVEGWVYMEPLRSDVKVRLIQVEVRDGKGRNIIRSDTIDNPRDAFTISVDKPCFARVEVYDASDMPLAFTNPVYLLPR